MPERGWDPFRSREMLNVLWSPMSTRATGGCGTFYTTLRRLIVGRELTVRSTDTTIRLTMVEFDGHPYGRALSVGQFGDIVACARDVSYKQFQASRVNAVLRNVHFHPGSPAQLVAAPVELEAELSSEVVSALMKTILGPVILTVDGEGIGRVSWRRRRSIGYLEVDVAVMGATLVVRPRHLVLRGRRWALPRWVPCKSIAILAIRGVLIKDVTLQPDSVSVTMQLPEWKFDLPKTRWGDIVTQLSSPTGQLDLTRVPRPKMT
jgi:hypothetical protein